MKSGISVREILNTAIISAMREVGCLFEREEYFLLRLLLKRIREAASSARYLSALKERGGS